MAGETAFEDETLRISVERGNDDVLVVAFAGVGFGLGDIQTEEFRKSLKGLSEGDDPRRCHIVYVIEKQRVWYNNGIAARLPGHVNDVISGLGASRVVTLGNSMGGFGAIAFAPALQGCRRALAFCPQSSVHPAIAPFETRYAHWVQAIRQWDLPDAAASFDPAIHYSLYFGADEVPDMQHAARFRASALPCVDVHTIAGSDHRVANYLREGGKLRRILRQAIWN